MNLMKLDILFVLIVACGVVLLTFSYLQDRPPYLVIVEQEGVAIVVDVYGQTKCSMNITGNVKNLGDTTAFKSNVECRSNQFIGFGSASDLGEVLPHKTKEFSMTAHFPECPTTNIEFLCEAGCENCA
ncbi:hypothetical protein BEH94_12005 [Candidatus Altiarchaeales archaeon WOR_SM1_SCG]|nr:hypothetical protein BEH94_12005 [Candidatus Altiarchaeales archaeon WOR_SM1_SCG]